jgi:hypothetical protein
MFGALSNIVGLPVAVSPKRAYLAGSLMVLSGILTLTLNLLGY